MLGVQEKSADLGTGFSPAGEGMAAKERLGKSIWLQVTCPKVSKPCLLQTHRAKLVDFRT